MIWSPPNRPAWESHGDLAAALREGLEGRRFFRPPAPASPPAGPPAADALARLAESAGVVGYTAPAGGPVRLVRRAVKWLLNPWLDRQTHFNHAAADYLHAVHAYAAALADQVNALHRAVAEDVPAGYRDTNARLNEALYDVHQLREAVARVPAADAPPPPDDPVHVVEGLFLHTRLTPPPARVLVLAPLGRHALDLATLGYQVVQTGAAGGGLVHPALHTGDDEPDGAFDWVVALSGEGDVVRAAGRVLAPGGRVVGSAPVVGDIPTAAEVAAAVRPFRLTEVAYAARAGHGWSLSPDPVDGAERVLWTAAKD